MMKNTKRLARIVAFLLALVVSIVPVHVADAATTGSASAKADKLTVYFLDMGQGDAAIIQCGGQTMMIDGGKAKASSFIYSWLKQHDVSYIDYMVATHPDADHIGGLSGALNYAKVGTAYQQRRAELARKTNLMDHQIKELEEKLREAETAGNDGTAAAVETIRGFAGATGLTQGMVQALIDKVLVYDPEHVEIRWKFSDDVMRFISEAEG